MDTPHAPEAPRADLPEEDRDAWDRILPLVYDELRRISSRHLRRQRDGHTLCTTALVHEAYLKLADGTRVPYAGDVHFFRVASRAMRQVLVDHARRHQAEKRGGDWLRVPLDESEVAVVERAETLLELDEALTRLAGMNERLARVVECRFFGGLTEDETAAGLGVTARTVRRDWTKARLWLYGEMRKGAA
jgi:RNA polymerase sigma factor (TIGR02999 family)